jgi:hypothetical protein
LAHNDDYLQSRPLDDERAPQKRPHTPLKPIQWAFLAIVFAYFFYCVEQMVVSVFR